MPGDDTTHESAAQDHTAAGGTTQGEAEDATATETATEQATASETEAAASEAQIAEGQAQQQDGESTTEQTKGKEPEAGAEEAKPLELSLPESGRLSEQDLETIRDLAGKREWNQEQAQAALDFWDQERAEIAAMHAEWREQSEKDPEIGGDRLRESAEHAKRALERFGSDQLTALMEESKLGDHPAVVRFFLKLGKAMAEDVVVTSGGAAAPRKKDFADLYT